MVHDFGEFAHEPAACAKPVDVTERSGIVADHSVVRSRCSGAKNLEFDEHGFRESVGGRRFPLVNVLLFEKVVLLVENRRWTTEWSTTLASPLTNRLLARSRLMEASVERRIMPGRGSCRTLSRRGFPGSISRAPRSAG